MSTTMTSDELAAISKAYSEMEFVGLVPKPIKHTLYKNDAELNVLLPASGLCYNRLQSAEVEQIIFPDPQFPVE